MFCTDSVNQPSLFTRLSVFENRPTLGKTNMHAGVVRHRVSRKQGGELCFRHLDYVGGGWRL